MGKIVAINPSGREVQIDEEALPYLQRANPKWREKSLEETMSQERSAAKDEAYSGIGQTAQAFAEGAVGGVTLGLAQPDSEEAQERAARHPYANAAGNFAGMLAPAVLTEGASLGESGIGAGAKSVAGDMLAQSPAGLLSRGASAAAEKVATSRIGRMAAQGAIEGFGSAAAQNVGAALRGDPVTQEAVVTSLGLGTVLGYGLGAVGGKALEKLEGKASKALAAKFTTEIPEVTGEDTNAFKSILEGPEAQAHNAKVSAAFQDAKDHLDSRIARGEWAAGDMEEQGNRHAVDFEQQMNHPDRSLADLEEPVASDGTAPGAKTGAYARPAERPPGLHGPESPEYNNSMYEDVYGPEAKLKRIHPGVEKSDSVVLEGINTEPGEAPNDPSLSKFERDNMFVGGKTHVSPSPEFEVEPSQIEGVSRADDTISSGMPQAAADEGNVLHREYWTPEHQAAGKMNAQLAKYYFARKLLNGEGSVYDKFVPDLTIDGLRKMTPNQVAMASNWMDDLDRLAPNAAKIIDDAIAGAFNTQPLNHPAELIDVLDQQGRSIGKMSGGVTPAEHPLGGALKALNISQEMMGVLGNSGKAKNLAALWATVKSIDENTAKTLSEETVHGIIDGHIKAASGDMTEAINSANKDSANFLEHGVTEGKGKGSSFMQRAVKRSVGRSAAKLAAKVGLGAGLGGAAGYALGWGVADSLLFGGMVGGVGNRIAKLAGAARRRGLTAIAKALAGQGGSGRGAIAGFVSARDALATPAGLGEESHRNKDLRTLYNMRRDQALKFNGQSALEAATQTMGPVAQIDPELAKSFVSDAVRRANYLANAAPKDPPWARFDKEYTPSREEMRRFAEIHRAVHDPNSVLEDFANGYVSPDAAKAFRETSPGMFSAVVQYITETVDVTKLNSNQALNLSILTGIPMSANLSMVNQFQQTFVDAATDGESGGQTNAMAANVVKKAVSSGDKPTAAEISSER
jgi:hypothetical protein